MNHLICKLVSSYLDEDYLTIYKLVCRDLRDNINLGYRGKVITTPYSVLTSKSLLSYSHDILNLVYDENVVKTIIKIGDLDSIKYLYTKTNIIDSRYLDISAEYGNLMAMKWLRANGCAFDNTFEHAARNGNLENMKWLLENGCPFEILTFSFAAKNGTLENMKWLLDNGCPYAYDTFHNAAFNGNLMAMKWLLENGCPFGNNTFCYAAKNGNLENMKWLLENGCQLCNYTFSHATSNGNQENIDWLIANGCPQN